MRNTRDCYQPVKQIMKIFFTLFIICTVISCSEKNQTNKTHQSQITVAEFFDELTDIFEIYEDGQISTDDLAKLISAIKEDYFSKPIGNTLAPVANGHSDSLNKFTKVRDRINNAGNLPPELQTALSELLNEFEH